MADLRAHTVHTLDDRVAILKDLVLKGPMALDKKRMPLGSIRDPRMRQMGLAIVSNCPPRADMCELKAIYDFMTDPRNKVRYTGDIAGFDTYQNALKTLVYFHGGDCDDHAVANAVLAMVNGYATKFRITSNTGASWDHIYTMAGTPKHDPKKWVALDTTLGPGKFNVEPGRAKYRDFLVGTI